MHLMMSVPKTFGCNKQHKQDNYNLEISRNSKKISSIRLLNPCENLLGSRIPVLIERYHSPGPLRRSINIVSPNLRTRRSCSLTNSPVPKPKATNTKTQTYKQNNYYGQQHQQQIHRIRKMATETFSPIKKNLKENEMDSIDSSCLPVSTINSCNSANSIISITSAQIDKKDNLEVVASTLANRMESIVDKNKISHCSEMDMKCLQQKCKKKPGTSPENSNEFLPGLKTHSNSISNGPISTILEEGGCMNDVTEKRDINGMTLNLNGPLNKTKVLDNSFVSGTKVRTPKTPHTPRTPGSTPNGLAANKLTPKTPPVTPDSYNTYLEDDLDSLYSYSSGRSTMSCEHPYVARNGTTFSGRKMKYVVHCSSYAGQVGLDYLTPTQRAQKQLRKLKELLAQARQDLEQKDSELCRLTREVVELRLFKASLSSPEDRSNSSDAVTVREAPTDLKTSQDISPIIDDISKSSPRHLLHSIAHLNSEMQSSFADSGHFEDMTSSNNSSSIQENHPNTEDAVAASTSAKYEEQRAELISLYEKKIEELIKIQDIASSDMKQVHNDRVEALLQKLAECNTRYADIVPDYEQAKERIRELEKQMDDLQAKLLEEEEKQKKMYLHMYTKGQEAEKIAHAEQIMEIAHRAPNRVSIPELLQQLQSTQDELENIRVANSRERVGDCALLTAKEAISLWVLGARKTIYRRLIEAQQSKTKVDPEVTLQFLKSAIYYFLTDKENSQGHLKAIESILQFTEEEKSNISKARASK